MAKVLQYACDGNAIISAEEYCMGDNAGTGRTLSWVRRNGGGT